MENTELLQNEHIEDESINQLLCEYRMVYSKNEAWKYQRYVKGPAIRTPTWILCGILIAAGMAILVMHHGNWTVFPICLVFAAAIAGLTYLVDYISIRRYYKRTAALWNGESLLRIYEEGIEIVHADQSTYIEYDDFYKIQDFDDRMYLIAGPKKIVIIDKEKVNFEIIKALQEL